MEEQIKELVEFIESNQSEEAILTKKNEITEQFGAESHRIFQHAFRTVMGKKQREQMIKFQEENKVLFENFNTRPIIQTNSESVKPVYKPKILTLQQIQSINKDKIITDILENEERFNKLDISIKLAVSKVKNKIKIGENCSGCKKNKIIREFNADIRNAVTKKSINVEQIKEIFGEENGEFITSFWAIGSTNVDGTPRDACQECTKKHLSQAMILAQEVVQGYPEHIGLALGHIEAAFTFAPITSKSNIMKIKQEIQDAMAVLTEIDKCAVYLRIAEEIIKTEVGSDLKRWRAIGHLCEAADECALTNPMLANVIREERRKLMEDELYQIDFNILYVLANDVKDSKIK